MKIKIPSLNFFNKMISKGIYVIPIGNFEYVVGATYNREDLSDRVTKEGREFLINKLNSILSVDYEVLSISAGASVVTAGAEVMVSELSMFLQSKVSFIALLISFIDAKIFRLLDVPLNWL